MNHRLECSQRNDVLLFTVFFFQSGVLHQLWRQQLKHLRSQFNTLEKSMLTLLRGVAVNKMKLKWQQITQCCCRNQCFRHLDSPCRLPKCSINILISGIDCTICDVYYQFSVSFAKLAYVKPWMPSLEAFRARLDGALAARVQWLAASTQQRVGMR